MAITGFTGLSELADSVPAEQVSGRVIPTAYATAVLDNVLGAFGEGYGHDFISGSNARSYTRLGSLSAAGLTEGTDADPTALSDTQVTVTIVECGVGVAYGDKLDVSLSTPGGRARVAALMGKAYGDYVDAELMKFASDFADAVGSSSAAMTEDIFLQAIHELEENQVPGPYIFIGSTTQIHDMRGFTSSATSGLTSRPDVLTRSGPAMANAWVTRFHEVDVFKTTNCETDGGTGKLGILLPLVAEYFPLIRLIGVPQEGPWTGQPWDGRWEEQRDASGRLTEFWVTGCWKGGCLATDYGIEVNTLA